MESGFVKVEEKDRLGVISLLVKIELLVDTHMQLWKKPSLGGRGRKELKQELLRAYIQESKKILYLLDVFSSCA